MNSTVKKILKYIVFIAIALALLYFAFKGTDFEVLVDHLKHANYWWVGFSLVMGYAAVISRGYRWLILLEPLGYKPRVWSSIHAVSFGYMFNIFVPRGGELGRCGVMNKAENIPVDKLFGTVILERLIDFIFLIGVVGLAFILNIDNFFGMFNTQIIDPAEITEEKSSNLIYYLAAAGLMFLTLFLIFRRRIIEHPKFEKVREFWNGLKEGFASFKTMNNKWMFIFHSVFIWLMYFLMVYVCFYSLPETANLTVSDGFFIMMAASLGIVIPAPGGMGSYHYLVTLALVVLGLTKSVGLSFATIVHTSQTLMLLSAGLIGLIYFSFSKKVKNADPKSEPQAK